MPEAQNSWPPNYDLEYLARYKLMLHVKHSRETQAKLMAYYATHPIDWINDWGITFNPRNDAGKKVIPFILFKRQVEFIQFLESCLHEKQSGLVEKSRDIGATWLCCAYSVWLWLFHPGTSVGWGSRDEDTVDLKGNTDSIFEKMRLQLNNLPKWMMPQGFDERLHCKFMNIINPANGSTIKGDAGKNIGRGGRSTIYFKDESAHYEDPESIEAALGDNTDVQIDISSVHGTGNVFYKRRMAGEIWEVGKQIARGIVRVFIFDWRDHPGKTQEWYDERYRKHDREGMLHILAQEVDRDYSASIASVIIPAKWVKAAIDAHIKLGIEIKGASISALDVADEGGDKNCYTNRKGILLRRCVIWGEGDTTETTEKALLLCVEDGAEELNYDCIGVGAGIKGETNRLKRLDKLPNIAINPWDAGSNPEGADKRMFPDDPKSPKVKDILDNRKIQGWWNLRQRFEKTFKYVTKGIVYPHDELISLDSKMENLHQLETELSQPIFEKDGNGVMRVQKKPKGTQSPNAADSCMMDFHPMRDMNAGEGYLQFLKEQHAAKLSQKPVDVPQRQ